MGDLQQEEQSASRWDAFFAPDGLVPGEGAGDALQGAHPWPVFGGPLRSGGRLLGIMCAERPPDLTGYSSQQPAGPIVPSTGRPDR